MRGLIIGLIGCVVAGGAAVGAQQQQQQQQQRPAAAAQAGAAPEGRADVGRTVYVKNGCFQCHGHEAQGGVAGPRLGPGPLPLAAFRAYVRTPRGDMPAYTAKVLPDGDVADIHAFLRAQPQPRAVREIPLLAP